MEAYQRLEYEYAEFCDNPNTVVCSSGTAALHLALETLKVTERWTTASPAVGTGQVADLFGSPRVVVPDFAMIACARAVTLAGMTPKFADVDELGLLNWLELTDLFQVVIVVHTYGRNSIPSNQIATPYFHSVVEDLAEAHGIQPNPNSLAACWSFYKNKIIAGEEGGMVAFKTAEQASLAKKLRNMGFEMDGQSFCHIPRGMNYRMSNCHAELILHSLHNYNANLVKRKQIEEYYNEYCPEEWLLPRRDVPWVYDLNLPIGIDIDAVVGYLNTMGIEARCGFKSLSQQEEYRQFNSKRHLEKSGTGILNPVADRLSKTRMYLPIKEWMTKNLIARTMKTLEEAVERLIEYKCPF